MTDASPTTSAPIQPPSVLLLGAPGSGKTYSISTLIEAGLEVFVLVTEPAGVDTLLDVIQTKKLPVDKIHWKAISPARIGFAGLLEMAKKVSISDFESLAKLRPSGQRQHSQWMTLLETLCDFKDDRTGQSYGDVTKWGPERALVIDSLSGLNLMAMDLVIGDKPSAHQGEWGIAMSMLDKLILNLTSSLRCIFVMIAHVEREVDEVTGVQKVMASTLGRKLAPRIPRFFGDVVLTYREKESFFWSTSTLNVDLKNRALPISGKLEPTFKPVVEAYRRRLATAQPGRST